MSVELRCAKSTVSRIARTLESEGFLERCADGDRFKLGLRLWQIGAQVIADYGDFPKVVRPHLVSLAAAINESVQAAVLIGEEAVYVEKVDAARSIRTHADLGARFPTYCTATGKVLLAYQAESVVNRVIRSGLQPHSRRTVTSAAQLRRRLEEVRSRGYAVNVGEWRDDVGGIAAPVFGRDGTIVGAIGVTLPLARLSRENEKLIIKAVTSVAMRISRELGYLAEEGDTKARRSSGRPPAISALAE